MNIWEASIPLAATLGLFALVGFVVRTIVDGRRRRERIRLLADVQSKLIEKIGSAHDFGQLLETDSGARLMHSLASEPENASAPGERVLRALQTGLVLTLAGTGFVLVSWIYGSRMDPGNEVGVGGVGVLLLSIGVGFLLASSASVTVARRLGLLPAHATAREQL